MHIPLLLYIASSWYGFYHWSNGFSVLTNWLLSTRIINELFTDEPFTFVPFSVRVISPLSWDFFRHFCEHKNISVYFYFIIQLSIFCAPTCCALL